MPVVVALRSALFSLAAVLASFGLTYALCVRAGANPSPAVLAAALTVGLMRRPQELGLRAIALKLLTLPLVALAAGLVGLAFLRVPPLGAVLFTAGIALSIGLRRYGEKAAAVGRIVALPFLAMLIVPVSVDPGTPKGVAALLVLAAGVASVLCSGIVAFVAKRLAIVPPEKPERSARTRPERENAMPVSTRMGLQMLVALAAAFTIGLWAFPAHWPWIVLSAFIVTSGAVGRGDAVYKALLRLGGAIGGTLVAAIASHATFPSAGAYAAAVFFVLFLGMWLREINYAFWAACATLIFALLQGHNGEAAGALFGARVLCIFIGAACGVFATWFVFPIRTEQVVRRRIADALAAMREALDGGSPDLDVHAAALRRVAPPVRLHRAVFGARNRDEHPATWIERAHALIERMRAPDFDRKQAGAEMRGLRDAIVKPPDKSRP